MSSQRPKIVELELSSTVAETRREHLSVWLIAVQAILAYEWLISGIDNYFLQGSTPLPWFNPATSLSPGVDINILIPLLSLTLLAANVRALRAGRAVTAPPSSIEGEAA